MNKRWPTTLSILIFTFLGFFVGYAVGQSPAAPHLFGRGPTEAQLESFWEVWDLVHTRYYQQPVDDVILVEGAIVGMLDTLDDTHTRYLSPEDQEAAERNFDGKYQGIGAEVENVEGYITIVSPIDGSPAEAAGLMPGDILRAADGVDLTGMDVGEAVGLVRGPAGTAVLLTIERDGETFDIEIVRDVVILVSVSGEMLADNLAYIRLSRFGDSTNSELNGVLEELMAANPDGLILDLRRNPGGALNTTVDIADEFLSEGTVLVERFGDGRERLFESEDGGLAEEVPMVILIDEGSASASEVLAGAIQDRRRGTLIGQTSFGKGTVQTWHTLSNKGGIRITIAQWLTPEKASIHKQGLTPDYFIPLAIEGSLD
ncbi:MAG: S41 family peptidase, partial [Chloroflexi bacterium]|nr:S41 family peptidase [Chloroflexota bacterium]